MEGRLQTRSWEDKEGQTRRVTEIIAENIQLGPKPGDKAPLPKENSLHAEHPQQEPVINLDGDEEDTGRNMQSAF